MQTFLPYASFIESVKVLDSKRLGKQRVEAYQILKALSNPNYGWKNHPIVKMWRGYEEALKMYMNCCIEEWIKRGYKNTMIIQKINQQQLKLPLWLGNSDFHASHRAALLAKNYDFYKQYNWSEVPKIEYLWIL